MYSEQLSTERYRLRHFILSELQRAARFGGVMTRDELLLWKWDMAPKYEIYNELRSLEIDGRIARKGEAYTISERRELLEVSDERRKNAQWAEARGRELLERIMKRTDGILLCGIGGSVSYGSMSPGDDIDIIIIAADGALWGVLKHALLEARKYRESAGGNIFCFSYSMERHSFEGEGDQHRTRLFASDFLHMRVVHGMGYYSHLLRRFGWIGHYYPHAYALKCDMRCKVEEQATTYSDGLSYFTVSNYLKLWAKARNVFFRISNRKDSEFDAVISRDRCIYASRKWRRLEEEYS